MPERCVLAIDVGNSRVKAGLFGPAPAGALPPLVRGTAFPVRDSEPATVIRRWLLEGDESPEAVLLGGVNPGVIRAIRDGWPAEDERLVVLGRPSAGLLPNRTEAPDRVGPDRLFDAVAANRVRPAGAPAIVVDSGTATTVNLLGSDGAFLGGAILAGFELVASALHERTALLPRIEAKDLTPPPEPLGRDTESALRSGLYWGLVGGVREVVGRLSAAERPMILLTGGAWPLLAPHLTGARVEPYLTLQGMVLSAEFGSRSAE